MRPVRVWCAPNGLSARIVAARLGSEGILCQLRGPVDGPYPVGVVEVLVDEAEVPAALAVLMSGGADPGTGVPGAPEGCPDVDRGSAGGGPTGAARPWLGALLALLLLVPVAATVRAALGG